MSRTPGLPSWPRLPQSPAPRSPRLARAPFTGPIIRIDTLRGNIRGTGDDAVTSTDIVLVTPDGRQFELRGPTAELLANAWGMDVWVSGEITGPREMFVLHWAFRDGNDDCQIPMVKVLPDLGRPCDDPIILRPIDPGNRAV